MALWNCPKCTTAFAVGLERCPHCGEPASEATSLPEATTEGAAEPRDVPADGEPEPELEKPARRRKSADDG